MCNGVNINGSDGGGSSSGGGSSGGSSTNMNTEAVNNTSNSGERERGEAILKQMHAHNRKCKATECNVKTEPAVVLRSTPVATTYILPLETLLTNALQELQDKIANFVGIGSE